jgi:hypothetical protein
MLWHDYTEQISVSVVLKKLYVVALLYREVYCSRSALGFRLWHFYTEKVSEAVEL